MHERLRVEEAERQQVQAAPVAPPPESMPITTASVLQMQRTVGNGAVAAMIARNGTEGGATAAPTLGTLDPDEKAFDDAVKAKDWPAAAAVLGKLAKPETKLAPLPIDDLRLLQDASLRAMRFGTIGKTFLAQMALANELEKKGVPVTKIPPGSAFGTLDFSVVSKKDGDKATGVNYAYQIKITFTPDVAVVAADEIAFIQTVRLVETASGDNKDWDETNKKRQTPKHTSVDRLAGREQGWYGMTDAGGGGGTLTPWKKAAPATPASMGDTPSADIPNTTWEFETMAVCRSGTDVGKVYAVVTWGFRVDAALKLTESGIRITNKQTEEATTTVGKWNDQAAGPEADRNAPGQKTLPTLK